MSKPINGSDQKAVRTAMQIQQMAPYLNRMQRRMSCKPSKKNEEEGFKKAKDNASKRVNEIQDVIAARVEYILDSHFKSLLPKWVIRLCEKYGVGIVKWVGIRWSVFDGVGESGNDTGKPYTLITIKWLWIKLVYEKNIWEVQ